MMLKTVRGVVVFVLAFAVSASVWGQSSMAGFNMPMTPSATQGMGVGAGISPYTVGAGALGGYGFPLAHLSSNVVIPGDNSIDENEYIVGAGDIFFISALESSTIKYTAAVDQSGRAFVQNVGLIDIGRVPYAEAKKKFAEQISSRLKNPTDIYVTLTQTKTAIVSITGGVASPGSYEFPGVMRLLDAIRIANGGILPAVEVANLRQVEVTNGDSSAVYDMLAYLYKDDRSQNPYIYPGDRIRVLPTTAKVHIGGAVRTPPPGFYPIRENETLKGFLSMFTLDNAADTGEIIVFQTNDNSKKTISGAEDMYHVLKDLDAITIPIKKNHPGIHSVSIFGEVASPGHYPIIENSTSAKQLIDAAGGMKATGNPDQAVVIRTSKKLPDQFSVGGPLMIPTIPERGVSVSMASSSQDYTVIRLILYKADNVILEPGDRIFIPKKDKFVYISGSVKNPGAYPFQPGKDYGYYVAQAGGYSKSADKPGVQVYLKYDDITQNIEPRCVEPGSVILVPSAVRHKYFSQVIIPAISAIATTIGVGIALYGTR